MTSRAIRFELMACFLSICPALGHHWDVIHLAGIGCYSESLDGSLCVLVSRFNHSCVPN